MNIIDLINELDENKDALLIRLLTEKLNQYNYKTQITDKEIKSATNGVRLNILRYLDSENERKKKAYNIVAKHEECEGCKYSVEKDVEHSGNVFSLKLPAETDVCKSCEKRCSLLYDVIDVEDKKMNLIVENTIKNNQELLKCKTIINKLNNKIKNLKL